MSNLSSETTACNRHPGLLRRLAAMFYDWVLLTAIILVAVTVFTLSIDLVFGNNTSQNLLQQTWVKLLYQLYLLSVAALFYAWFWTHGGQTLGMKVWKLRITGFEGEKISIRQALLRLLYVLISCLPLGLGFFWMLLNKKKLTLYDIWSKSHLVMLESE